MLEFLMTNENAKMGIGQKYENCNKKNIEIFFFKEMKVFRSRDVPGSPGKVPGPDRTGPRDLEGPVVPWSRGPVVPWSRDLTSPKVPGLENWNSPGTMETLVGGK